MTHARLPRDTCGDYDEVCAFERPAKSVVRRKESLDLCRRGDVGQIGGNTGRVDDIIEAKLSTHQGCHEYACKARDGGRDHLRDERAGLEEQRQRLSDSTYYEII